MLNNNEECNWSDFLEKPLEISLATLSKYINLLITNGYVEKKRKGLYNITLQGRKRYFNLRFKDSFGMQLRYPPKIILNKRDYRHIILWMLFNNTYCKWSDFLDNPLSINNNSLSKNLNYLLDKGFVEKEYSEYRITKSGESEYNRMLKIYDLDYQSILVEEIRRIEKIKEKTNEFLKKCEITDNNIKIIFLDLINSLDFVKIENSLPSKEDYYKILLFFTLNHPSNYPHYIKPKAFSLKFNLKIATLNFFVQKIVEENLYQIKFFKLDVADNGAYYFRVNKKFEKMLYLIIDENILKFSYLNKLQPNISKEEKDFQTMELLENILNDICDKMFDRNIKPSLKRFIIKYLNFLYSRFQKESHSDKLIDKFKGLALQNLVSLNLDDFDKIKKEKTVLTSILRDFPRYTVLEEIKKKMKK